MEFVDYVVLLTSFLVAGERVLLEAFSSDEIRLPMRVFSDPIRAHLLHLSWSAENFENFSSAFSGSEHLHTQVRGSFLWGACFFGHFSREVRIGLPLQPEPSSPGLEGSA